MLNFPEIVANLAGSHPILECFSYLSFSVFFFLFFFFSTTARGGGGGEKDRRSLFSLHNPSRTGNKAE